MFRVGGCPGQQCLTGPAGRQRFQAGVPGHVVGRPQFAELLAVLKKPHFRRVLRPVGRRLSLEFFEQVAAVAKRQHGRTEGDGVRPAAVGGLADLNHGIDVGPIQFLAGQYLLGQRQNSIGLDQFAQPRGAKDDRVRLQPGQIADSAFVHVADLDPRSVASVPFGLQERRGLGQFRIAQHRQPQGDGRCRGTGVGLELRSSRQPAPVDTATRVLRATVRQMNCAVLCIGLI